MRPRQSPEQGASSAPCKWEDLVPARITVSAPDRPQRGSARQVRCTRGRDRRILSYVRLGALPPSCPHASSGHVQHVFWPHPPVPTGRRNLGRPLRIGLQQAAPRARRRRRRPGRTKPWARARPTRSAEAHAREHVCARYGGRRQALGKGRDAATGSPSVQERDERAHRQCPRCADQRRRNESHQRRSRERDQPGKPAVLGGRNQAPASETPSTKARPQRTAGSSA